MRYKNAFFRVEVKDNGTYLNIFPKQSDGKGLELQEVLNYLDDKKSCDYNLDAVKKAVFAEGTKPVRVKISDDVISPFGESCTVNVSKDKMLATIRFYPPTNGGSVMTKKEILSELELNKITFGISEKTIDLFLKSRQYCVNYVIARGKKPVPAQNTQIEYYFNYAIKDNYDKYIVGGNKSKKQIAIIFKIDKEQNIDNIIDLLDKNKMTANLFISYDWASNNINKIKNLSNKNYVFGVLNETNNVDNENFKLLQTLIKINSSQTNYYCYTEEKSSDLLSTCSKNKHYTILPSIIIENNLLANLMKNISSGSIISININKNTASELSNALEYINSRGLKVVNLSTLLEE